ncbi:MAG: hypothetical protein AB7W16_15975 [Candidatus Obscuribacterales bacterium]
MADTFQCILDVLGKSDKDDAFERLAAALGERPNLFVETPKTLEYRCDSGFHLSFFKEEDFFFVAYIHPKSFKGDLPKNLRWGDTPDEVERKLGINPLAYDLFPGTYPEDPKHLQETYSCEPFLWKCYFDFSSGGLQSITLLFDSKKIPKGNEQVRRTWIEGRGPQEPS